MSERLFRLEQLMELLASKRMLLVYCGNIYDTVVINRNKLQLLCKGSYSKEKFFDRSGNRVECHSASNVLLDFNAPLFHISNLTELSKVRIFALNEQSEYIEQCYNVSYVLSIAIAVPAVGAMFEHYKSKEIYVVHCISKAGDKEDEMLYVTYRKKGADKDLYTRTLYSFLELIDERTQRFTEVE